MTLVFSDDFDRAFSKLDRPIQKRVMKYMRIVEKLENPRSRGKPMSANLSGLWRYRIGDYRVVCNIIDDRLLIIALNVGHRRDVYRP